MQLMKSIQEASIGLMATPVSSPNPIKCLRVIRSGAEFRLVYEADITIEQPTEFVIFSEPGNKYIPKSAEYIDSYVPLSGSALIHFYKISVEDYNDYLNKE